MMKRVLLSVLLCAAACKDIPGDGSVPSTTLDKVPGHDSVRQDTSHKEAPRLVPVEAYIRTYVNIFGARTTLEAQTALRQGGPNLFDNWNTYLGALGLPNYAADLPRKGETNALMIATFERLGIALCDRAYERDVKANPPVPVENRRVFAFDVPREQVDEATFARNFDVMHRTFLGYPAKLAPTDRTARFYKLYKDVAALPQPGNARFTANEAGWAAVCYGLVRHPEFQLY